MIDSAHHMQVMIAALTGWYLLNEIFYNAKKDPDSRTTSSVTGGLRLDNPCSHDSFHTVENPFKQKAWLIKAPLIKTSFQQRAREREADIKPTAALRFRVRRQTKQRDEEVFTKKTPKGVNKKDKNVAPS